MTFHRRVVLWPVHGHDNECGSFPHGKESDLIVELRYNRDKIIVELDDHNSCR